MAHYLWPILLFVFVASDIRCATRLCAAFILLHDAFFDISVNAPLLSSITRRLSHCYLKGFVRREGDSNIPTSSSSNRQLRKLQSV